MKKLDNLLAWKVFKLALETGNLTQASIQLDLDTAAASRLIDGLERELGEKLLYRNRRPFIATTTGDEILADVSSLIEAHDKLTRRFTLKRGQSAIGHKVITLSAAQGYGHGWLMPRLLEYMKVNDNVTFDTLTERNLRDLQEGRIEVLLSVHRFIRQGFVIKPYAVLPCIAFASPEYIRQYGMPSHPEELKNHVGLIRSGTNFPISHERITNGTDVKPLIWGKVIKAENSIVLKRLAVQGVGIVFDLPIGFFTEELAAGKLVPTIGNWRRTPFYCSVVTTEQLYKNDLIIRDFVNWMQIHEGKASNNRTQLALDYLGRSPASVFDNCQEFTQPEEAYFRRKKKKKDDSI